MGDSTSSASVPIVPTVRPWESSSSPYFLSNSDNPGVSLVVQHLTEENYSTWSRAVLIALDAKTKLGFIDGTLPKPESVDHPCYFAWCKCNSTVLAWLFNSVSKDLQSSVVYFKTAREVWLDLQHRFAQGNGPRIFELKREICSLTQEDLTINGYYTKFKSLWQEFAEYRTCSCGHQAEECVMSFLMGLNDTYTSVRGQILIMDPVPSLSKVFSLLLQDEKQRKVSKTPITEASALAVKNNGSFAKGFNKGKSGRPQCTHCGILGHVVDKCYKLHGYPPGYKFKNKGQQSGHSSFASNVVSTECNNEGNFSLTKSEYQQLLGLINSQNHFGTQASQEFTPSVPQVATIITQPPSQPSLDLQGHEMSGISSPIPPSSHLSRVFSPSLDYSVFSSQIDTTHLCSTDWILDSGATDHMIHSLQFFTSVTSIVHFSVKLPNGDMAKVTHIGTVNLTSTLTLHNVLCIPSFSFNLVSISKLTQSPSCCCVFLSHYCFIQDLQPWRMIGLGRKHGGLYTLELADIVLPNSVSTVLSKLSSFSFLNSVNSCTSASIIDSTSLWHSRLGHPSFQRLAILQNLVPERGKFG